MISTKLVNMCKHNLDERTARWGFGFNAYPGNNATILEIWDKKNNKWMAGGYIADTELEVASWVYMVELLLHKVNGYLADAILLRAEKEGRV